MEVEGDQELFNCFWQVYKMGYSYNLVLQAQKEMHNAINQQEYYIIQFIEKNRQQLEQNYKQSQQQTYFQQQQNSHQNNNNNNLFSSQQSNQSQHQTIYFNNNNINNIKQNGQNTNNYNTNNLQSINNNQQQQFQPSHIPQSQQIFKPLQNDLNSSSSHYFQQSNNNTQFTQNSPTSSSRNYQPINNNIMNSSFQSNNNNNKNNSFKSGTFSYDIQKKKTVLQFKEQKYEIDTNCEHLKKDKNIQLILQQIQNLPSSIQKKQSQKIPELKDICQFHILSAPEYMVWWGLEKEHKRKNKHKIDKDDEECSICMCPLYDMEELNSIQNIKQQLEKEDKDNDVIKLEKCEGHFFHINCFLQYLKNNNMDSHTKCPVCQKIYGIMKGKQPKGTMTVSRNKSHLSGHSNVGTITINYSFPSGSDPNINNGVAYSGTSRTAYLPDNKEGNEVLKLLQTAFDRKLTFQVGTSVTTGQKNTVVWAGIHHKTQTGSGAFGYPDATYFSRVKEELATRGVY